jgi:CHASE2 domain-containing sensor protein
MDAPQPTELPVEKPKSSFWSVVWEQRIALSVILGIVTAAHAFGLLTFLEFPFLDAWQAMLPATSAKFVRVVVIDDNDFSGLFGGHRPLDPGVVQRLIKAIAKGSPRVIGVDVDTSAARFSEMDRSLSAVPIVWARNASPENPVVPGEVLGGRPLGERDRTGIALAMKDSDGTIREIPRFLPTPVGPRVSFHWALVEEACRAGMETETCKQSLKVLEPPLVNLYRKRIELKPISASAVLDIAETGAPSAFKDRIVLLGGTFAAARDTHETPLGAMPGVEIWAHAIETELSGNRIGRIGKGWIVATDVAVALIIIWLHRSVGGRRAFLLYIAVIPLLMGLVSLMLFGGLRLWFTFAPVVVSILIHQLYHDYRSQH